MTYVYRNSVRGLFLPRAMYDLHLNDVTDIGVEVSHKPIDVEKVVELPTLLDQRVTENVVELHGIRIVVCR